MQSDTVSNIISIIAGGFIILIPFLCEYGNVLWDGNDISLITLAVATILLVILSILKFWRGMKTSITVTDVLCIVYLLYGAINLLVIRSGDFDRFLIVHWSAIVVVYILFRVLNGERTIIWSLIISAVVQSLYAIGQKMTFFSSNHNAFDVTGSFGNPGPLAGYLAVGFALAVCLAWYYYNWKNNIWMLYAASTSPIIVALFLADSRAAYLSVAISIMVFFSQFLNKYRRLCMVSIGMLAIFLLLFLYNYRPDSANARLLIWQTSTGMIKDSPLTGHGIASFKEKYMLYQAAYFEDNPDSPFSQVADNTPCAYDEFIHIGVEQGIVGLLLFLAIIISVLWYNPNDYRQRILQISLLVLILFSMFSYPADIFSLMLLFPLLFGALHGKVIFEIGLSKCLVLICYASLLLVVTIVCAAGISTLRKNSEIIAKIVKMDCEEDVYIYVRDNYDALKYNGVFSNHYPLWAKAYRGDGLLRMDTSTPSCETFCDIGDYFYDKNALLDAEKYYKAAVYMIPTRLTPKYKLWRLYMENGDNKAAMAVARQIITQPLKIETVFTIRAKAEVEDYLRQ